MFDIILLFAKQNYIYICKIQNTKPILIYFKHKMNIRYKIKQNITFIKCEYDGISREQTLHKPLLQYQKLDIIGENRAKFVYTPHGT